ncbi:hypothetical protein IKE_06451 [Bacillus cereus VD196]|uniref:Uncharacterized protein n=1 Tax=Bacillus cereus VD196 TaxID=1053243 RepID=A0A9W5V5G4_BACCE|nr:hypothetical protein [Bacillus cereus]EJR89505.1 hypothetical protein IKG_06119 [Bacillus cereus VD200]EOO56612.1 hypothetical protein IKE_06451 [Bacillus cereus VD196]
MIPMVLIYAFEQIFDRNNWVVPRGEVSANPSSYFQPSRGFSGFSMGG